MVSASVQPAGSSLGNVTLVDVLLELFSKADLDKDSVLSVEEIARVTQALTEHPKSTGPFLLKYVESCTDPDGCVYKATWEQYVECCSKVDMPESILADFVEIVDGLRLAADNGEGVISDSIADAGAADVALMQFFDSLDVAHAQSVPGGDLLPALQALISMQPSSDAQSLLQTLLDQVTNIGAGEDESTTAVSRDTWRGFVERLSLSTSMEQADAQKLAETAAMDSFYASLELPTIHTLSALAVGGKLAKLRERWQAEETDRGSGGDAVETAPADDADAARGKVVATDAAGGEQQQPQPQGDSEPDALEQVAATSPAEAEARGASAPNGEATPASREELLRKKEELQTLLLKLFDKMDADGDGILTKAQADALLPELKRHPSGAGYFLASFLESAAAPLEDRALGREDWELYIGVLELALTPELEQAFQEIVESLETSPRTSSGTRSVRLESVFLRLWEKATGHVAAAARQVALPAHAVTQAIQEVKQQGEPGFVLAWHLSRAAFREEVITFEAYVAALHDFSFPREVSLEFEAVIEQLDLHEVACHAGNAPPGAPASTPGIGEGGVSSEAELPPWLLPGWRLQLEELRVEEDESVDLHQPALQKMLRSCLGLQPNAALKEMPHNCGGLNEGVFIAKDSALGIELVLKLVKTQRRRPETTTDTENFTWLAEKRPEIIDDELLAFPRKIVTVVPSTSERSIDVLVMRRCPGRSLSEIIAGKLARRQMDSLMEVFVQVGRSLAEFHWRYGDWQHGDFTASNVFYDERSSRTSFIDMSDVGQPAMESDVDHFRKALLILERAYGDKAPPLTSDCFARFTEAYEEERRRRTASEES